MSGYFEPGNHPEEGMFGPDMGLDMEEEGEEDELSDDEEESAEKAIE